MNEDFKKPVVPERVANINAQIAAQGNKDFSVAPGTTDPKGNLVANAQSITSESLSNSETPINLPPIPSPSTTSAGITGASFSIVDSVNKKLAEDQAKKEAEKQNQKGLVQATIDRIAGIQNERTTAEGDVNTPGSIAWQRDQARKLADKIDISQRAQMNELKALETQGLTAAGSAAAQAGINRKYAMEQGDLQLQYHLANSDYQAAENTLNKLTELKLEPLKTQLTWQSTVYQDLQGSLTESEDRQFQVLIDQTNKELELQTENTKANADAITRYNSLGAGITINDTAEQRAQKIAKVGGEIGYQTQLEKIKNNASITAGLGADAPLYNGLSSATATAVRGIVSGFKSEPQLTNFATIQDGYNFTQKISDTTTNPADDQALIYSLAKALDPGSVVREGEYATAQKYAQSWVKAYGKSITQAIAGTGFLSEEARKNIKNVIETKYKSSKVSYDNLYNQYAKQINNLTGRDDGTKFLRDYSVDTSGGKQIVKSNGQEWVVGQVYSDGTANWVVDAKGNWTKQ